MKKLFIIFIFACLFPIAILSQGRILNYDELKNAELMKTIHKEDVINGFIIKTGDTVKIGSIVKFGKPFTNVRQSIPTSSINTNTYSSIIIGKPEQKSFYPNLYLLPVGHEGKTAIITEIVVLKVSKREPAMLLVNLQLQNMPNSKQFGVPDSFEREELYLAQGKLTKEQALSKLKEAKERLNLELISQKEYDDLKDILAPIIMGEN